MNLRPDPSFYPTPRMAMEAPVEKLAFTLMLSPDFSQPDGLAVVNVDPQSPDYGKIVHTVFMPNKETNSTISGGTPVLRHCRH